MSAVLQNWDLVEATKNTALTSEGSMDRQLEVYNESIQASLDKFKVAFQELSADIISSDVVKGVVDFGTTILNIIDKLIDSIGVLGTAITGLGIAKLFNTALSGARNVELATDSVELLSMALESAGSSGSGLGGTLKGLTGILGNFGAKASGAGNAIGTLFSSIGGFLTSPAGLITAGVAAVAGITAYLYKRKKEQEEALRKQATETTEKWASNKKDIGEYSQQYSKLNDQLSQANLTESERISIKQQLLDLQNEISAKYGTDASQIDLINGKFETQLDLISKISEKEAHRNLQDNKEAYQQSVDEMTKDRSYTMFSNGSGTELMKQIEWAYIRSGFKDQGDLSFEFTGDVSEADDGIRSLIDRLETLKDTANETEKAFIDNVIGSASKLLAKNNEILKANQDNYKAYLEQSLYDDGYGDELSKYSRLVQEYNDALAGDDVEYAYKKRSEMLAYYRDNIDGVFENTQYQEFFDGVTEQIDTTTERMMDWRDIVDDETTYASNKFIKSADIIRKTVDKLKALELDGVDIQAILGNPNDAMYADLSQLARLWDPNINLKDNDALQAFADFLEKIGVLTVDASEGVDLARSSFTDFLKSASTIIETTDKATASLVNSFGSRGLSMGIDAETGAITGDVAAIIKAYKDLDGYDPKVLFERTADGINVNTEALRALQSEQEALTKSEFLRRIAEAQKQLNEAGTVEAKQYWQEQLDTVRLLSTAYDGATSSYQKWIDAQKMTSPGSKYDQITNTALKQAKEYYDKGLTGNPVFKAIAQLFTNEDLSLASGDEITEAYEDGLDTVKKYFTEGSDGAEAFADKLVDLDLATKEWNSDLGKYDYDFSDFGINTSEIADELGISVDLVEALFGKLQEYDFEINFITDDQLTQLASLSEKAESARQKLAELADEEGNVGGVDMSNVIDIDIKGIDTVKECDEAIQQITEAKAEAEVDSAEYEYLDSILKDIMLMRDTLGTSVSPEISSASTETLKSKLTEWGEGGNVDLNVRPVIDAKELQNAGWEEAGEGCATLFTSTFSNEAGNVAMNFTPIIVDEHGNVQGILSPDELTSYAEGVISGVREDDLNLQIGGKFDGEDAIEQASETAEKIHEAHEELIFRGEFEVDDSDLVSIKDTEDKIIERLNLIEHMNAAPGVHIDIDNDEQFKELAQQLLDLDNEEVDAYFNIEGAETVDEVVEKLKEKYNVKATVTADTSAVPSSSTDIDANIHYNQDELPTVSDQTVHLDYEPNPLIVKAVAELDSTAVDVYEKSLKPIDRTQIFHAEHSEVDNYVNSLHDIYRTVYYGISVSGTGALDALPYDGQRRDIYYDVHVNGTIPFATGTVSKSAFQSMGASHIRGTAHASGLLEKVGLKSNEKNALINELGPEIVVRPSEDSWMIFNDGKPTFASLKKDDVIFNAELSRQLLQNGSADDYAKLLGGSYIGGTVRGRAHVTRVKGGGHFGGGHSTTKHTTGGNGGGGGGNNGGGGKGDSNKEEKEFSELLDEIEIKIDRIERSIKNLETVSSNTFKNQYTRQKALSKQITKTTQEVKVQQKAYERYMAEANKYADGLSKDIIEKIQNGKINIEEFKDEDTWKKIDNYKKYYEQAIACRDAVYELQKAEADLWKERFNIAQTNYENKIAQVQHMYDMMDSYIEMAENNGRITTNKYRTRQIDEEKKKLTELNKEYDGLKKKMADAMKMGSLSIGSEEYYEMLNQLNSIQEELVATKANISELNKSIRETNWDIFDKGLSRIAGMRDELEFIYGLLGEDMYDKKGKVTDNGIAGFGILASQYNFAMVESQKYAEEIEKINEEIANDPLNQDLINRRQELYESQRDAIEQANDYKESIRDLVKEGIELQIDSMKELIKNYEDLLDAQKDEMDYSKRVSDQQANINKLQKQLNAYANDDSEEGAARRQKLRNELKTAQENLQQTQEERRISQTKKMLSDLQEDYENVLNARLDDLEALVKAVTNGVNSNSTKISEAINVATANVGYKVTNEMDTLLSGGKNLVSYFLNGTFIDQLTKAIAVSNNIQNGVAKTVTKTENEQSKTVRQTETKQKNTQTEMVKAQNYKNKITGTDGKWLQDSNKQRIGWQFNDGTKATGWSKIDNDWYYFNDEGKIRAGLQKIGNYNYFLKRYGGRAESEWVKVGTKWYYFDKDGHALTGWHELEKDGTKGWRYFNPNTAAMATNAWVKNSSKDGVYYVNGSGIMVKNGKYETKDGWRTFDKNGKWKGYRLGTKNVGSDGLYWTNESAPETIIRKSDGAVLTKLNAGDTVFNSDATNTMWDFANDPMKFLRSLGYTGGTLSAGNDVDLVINLSGLRSPSEFMDALRRDKKFERFIQEITIGRVSGHGVLAKNAIAF